VGNNKARLYWLTACFLSVALIIVAGFIVCLRYKPGRLVEISLPPAPNHTGTIYLSGAVSNPGLYPFTATDTIESLIQAAGGIAAGANLSNVKLSFVPDGNSGPQKIDINHADPWLLEALPGIGTTLARRIVDYRQQNGLFRSTSDLMNINGMGTSTFHQLESMITVGE
jgi:competence protein ComEA